MAIHISSKHGAINKAETTMLAAVAIAAVLSIFGLFGIKSMLGKAAYQQHVLNAKHKVVAQLKSNLSAANQLVSEYKVFAAEDPNVLGGNVVGTSNLDGPNSQIILDALPSKYDAPALASSVEKILNSESVSIRSIQVKDDPASNPDQPLPQPAVKPIAFSFSAESTFTVDQKVIKDFERSIRPFDVTTLTLSGSDTGLTMEVGMNTYYQPAKSLNLTNTQVVK